MKRKTSPDKVEPLAQLRLALGRMGALSGVPLPRFPQILFNPTGILSLKQPAGLSAGAIAGIAVGCAAAAALLAGAAVLLVRRRRRCRRQQSSGASFPKSAPSSGGVDVEDSAQCGSGGGPPAGPTTPPPPQPRASGDGLLHLSPFTAAAAMAPAFDSSEASMPAWAAPAPANGVHGTPVVRGLPPPFPGRAARAGSAPVPQHTCSRLGKPPAGRRGSDPEAAAAARPHPLAALSSQTSSAAWQQQSPASRSGRLGSDAAGPGGGAAPSAAASASLVGGPAARRGVLPELVQHVAEQEAQAARAAAEGPRSDEASAELPLVGADTLPPQLRQWVVDGSALTFVCWPGSSKRQELGSGARWAGRLMLEASCRLLRERLLAVTAPCPPASLPQLPRVQGAPARRAGGGQGD